VAVESVRTARSQQPSGHIAIVSAADPLNLVGTIVPGERVPANSGATVTYRDGSAVAESRLHDAVV
jgi:ATP-dependent Lhr-like helicase